MALKIKCFTFLILLVITKSLSQNKYITREGIIEFESQIETFEPIKAKQNSVTSVFNADTGEIAVLALVKGFRFKNALMEEHFNENYVESDTYPKTTFKGKILDFSINSNQTKYIMKGTINFHGVDKTYDNIPVDVIKDKSKIKLQGKFVTPVKDFNIKIPKIVSKKIAADINVTFELILQKIMHLHKNNHYYK